MRYATRGGDSPRATLRRYLGPPFPDADVGDSALCGRQPTRTSLFALHLQAFLQARSYGDRTAVPRALGCAARSRLRTLPVAVRGSSSTKVMSRGTLKRARLDLTQAFSSSGSGCCPSRATTYAASR